MKIDTGDGFLGGESADLDRILIWQGLDSWRSEVVNLRLGPRGLLARGGQSVSTHSPTGSSTSSRHLTTSSPSG